MYKKKRIQARGSSTCKGRNEKILPEEEEEELGVMGGEAKMVN